MSFPTASVVFPTASVVLLGRVVMAAGANGYALAIAWQRFSNIILAMNARNPDLAQSELLAVERLTDGNRVRLRALVIFCTRRRVRELAGLHPTPADLSALVAAHVEDYKKVIRDDGAKFYRVLKTIMLGPEKMPANTLLVYASGALASFSPRERPPVGWRPSGRTQWAGSPVPNRMSWPGAST